MKKQVLTYPFTAAGVAQWQADLAAAGAAARHAEATRVETGLDAFVPMRFELQAEQVAFLDNLPTALCSLWAAQIAYAIREQQAVVLVKPEQRARGDDDESSKFIESEARNGSGPELEPTSRSEGHYFVRFTIGY